MTGSRESQRTVRPPERNEIALEAEADPGVRLEAALAWDRAWRAARQARAEAWLPGILQARLSRPMILEWWSIWTRRMGSLSSLAGFGLLLLGCLWGWVEATKLGVVLMVLCQRGWFLPMVAFTPLLVGSSRAERGLHRWVLRWAEHQGLRVEAREVARRTP